MLLHYPILLIVFPYTYEKVVSLLARDLRKAVLILCLLWLAELSLSKRAWEEESFWWSSRASAKVRKTLLFESRDSIILC